MGKAKKQEDDGFTFIIDVRAVLAMKPDQRVKWLSKACRRVADGEANVKHVFDVLSNRRITSDMALKAGQRMLRALREHLYLFSEKQQRYLSEESPLATQFALDGRSDDERVADMDERATARGSKPVVDDAAAKMEEMMARCRDFVRAKASSFEDRQKEAEEAEEHARLQREQEAVERLAREWDEIRRWHQHLEPWEQAHMSLLDERTKERQVQAQAAAAAAAAAGTTPLDEVSTEGAPLQAPDGHSRHSRGRSGSNSDAECRVRKEKDRTKEKEKAKERDGRRRRDRSRSRRRRCSSSCSSRGARGKEKRRDGRRVFSE